MDTIEIFDADKLRTILKNKAHFKQLLNISDDDDDQKPDPFCIAQKYLLNSKNGKIKVQYERKNNEGRLYAKKSLSLQNLKREIRGTIADKYYYDVDMVNCHAVLIHHIADVELDFEMPYLSSYIKKREDKMKDLLKLNKGKSRKDIKDVFLSIFYRGDKLYDSIEKTEWLVKFKKEFDQLYTKLNENYKDEIAEIKKKYNKDGSFLSSLAQVHEDKILNFAIQYFEQKKLITNNYVCCFDGLMIPKAKLDKSDLEDEIEILEKQIKKKFKIPMKFLIKPMETLDLDDIPEQEDEDPKFFQAINDKYFWMDFMNELKNRKWFSMDEAKEFCKINLNRVMLMLATDEMFIKVDEDEPFQAIKDLPRYIISFEMPYNLIGSTEISFRTFFYNHLINYVKMYNKLSLKPLSPMDDVIEKNNSSRDFNVWTGFKAQLLPKKSVNNKLIEKLLNHIKVVWANNDEAIFKYILSWFHTIFKNPASKSKVAMVFQSDDQQIGKSIVLEEFLIPFVFGKKLSIVEEGIGFATERFNNRMIGKLLVCCEELNNIADTGNYHSTFDTMKKLITNKTMQLEWKNGAKIEIDSFINFILFTNNQFSIKVEKSDARYFITQCNPIFKKNFSYFNDLVSTFNQESADHFFSYAYHMDDVVDVRDIPDTNIKQEIKLNCLPSPQRFLYRIKDLRDEKTDEEFTGWKNYVIENDCLSSTQLYTYYKAYCQEEHEREQSLTKFGRCIGTMIEKIRNKDGWKYQLNSIK